MQSVRTRSIEMFTILEISRTFNLRLSVTKRGIFLFISGIVAPEGLPECGSSFMFVRPNLDSCIHLLTIVFDGADVP